MAWLHELLCQRLANAAEIEAQSDSEDQRVRQWNSTGMQRTYTRIPLINGAPE